MSPWPGVPRLISARRRGGSEPHVPTMTNAARQY